MSAEMDASATVSLIVPILDEAHGVRALLFEVARVRPSWLLELVFVDGGSRDGSLALVERASSEVVRPPVRQKGHGFAAALREGLAASRGSVIVTMDGDGAHRVEDVVRLLGPIERGADLAIARRYGPAASGMPGRKWCERMASRAAALTWSARHGMRLHDPLHGFRARTARLARAVAPALASVEGNVWLGVEALEATRLGFTVEEEPIPYGRRIAGSDHKRLGREGLRFLSTLFRAPR
jgi:hypothetical protein